MHVGNILVAAILVILFLFFGGKLGPAIRDMFGGGPRPPSHPLPGDDSVILNRPRARRAPQTL